MLKMVVTRQFHVRGMRLRKGREKLKLLKMDSIDPIAVQQESTGHVARGHRARILDMNDCFQNLECVGFSIITWPPYDIIKSMRSATLSMRAD